MDGKAAVFSGEIDIFELSGFVVCRGLLAEGKALFLELRNGAFQIRCLHGDMAVSAVERRFHALEIRPGELGLLPAARRKIEHAGQKLRERERFFGVLVIDADVTQGKNTAHFFTPFPR